MDLELLLGARHIYGLGVYLANYDARARSRLLESMGYGQAHRLDRVNALKPANRFDFRSLTLKALEQTD